MMDKIITIICPCCNTEITIDRATGEISSGFCFEILDVSEVPEYEFGEKEVVGG